MTRRKKPGPRRYAEGTSVPVERSRAELEKLLDQHKATSIGIMRHQDRTMIAFQMNGLNIIREVQVPTGKDMESEHRRRWRALVLIVKAKLEMIHGGESTVEREFLADLCLPNGNTFEQEFLPKMREALAGGVQPKLLLPSVR